MKPEDFEQRLARTPLQPPPAAWREEILAAARTALPAPPRSPLATLATLWNRWRLLRPAATPWTALAGAWLLVLALHGVGRSIDHRASASVMSPDSTTESPAALIAAARSYHARVLAIASLDGAPDITAITTIDESEPSALPPAPKAGRPRSHWKPTHPGTGSFDTPRLT